MLAKAYFALALYSQMILNFWFFQLSSLTPDLCNKACFTLYYRLNQRLPKC